MAVRRGSILQAQLRVGPSDDPLEHEADRVAERMLASPPPPAQQREPSARQASAAPPAVHEELGSAGRPLDAETRAFFEPRLGLDLDPVRVHTDGRAAAAAAAVEARAYAVGEHVVFGAGEYAPTTPGGRRLLAHELAHVAQQRASAGPAVVRRTVTIPFADSSLQITAGPSTGLEIKNLLGKWRALPRTPEQIVFSASVTPRCAAGDSTAGYEVGIVQMQTRDVNNARYVGRTPADGSLWIRRDIPTVRPPGPCHDSPWGRITARRSGALFWNESSPVGCNTRTTLEHRDFPQDMYDTIVENPITHAPNYLSELHLAFDFTTALMLRRPDNRVETLRWAGWSVGWDYTFDTPPSGESSVRHGVATTGAIEFAVPMPTPPELPTRYALPAKNCNTITQEASDNPARIVASAGQRSP